MYCILLLSTNAIRFALHSWKPNSLTLYARDTCKVKRLSLIFLSSLFNVYGAISYNMDFGSTQFTSLCFRSLSALPTCFFLLIVVFTF
jgi:hypothetical protein